MIITKTPLRISILGGNTDFPEYFRKHGGAVVTMTIDKYIYCIVKERFDDQIWINYSKKEIVDHVNQIKHELVREAMKLTGVTKGVEITFLSDIPATGSGLGSSSAVTIGILHALHVYAGNTVTSERLAREACYIELQILKKPIGIQDQYAIASGGFNLIEMKDEIKIRPMDIPTDSLMLFYTGITRKSENILSKMKLDKNILDETKSIALKARSGHNSLGVLMNQHWMLKKELNSAVTNKVINHMYSLAMEAGAEGGKIVGAGGGGFLLLSVPTFFKNLVRDALKDYRELPFKMEKYGSKVIFDIN